MEKDYTVSKINKILVYNKKIIKNKEKEIKIYLFQKNYIEKI